MGEIGQNKIIKSSLVIFISLLLLCYFQFGCSKDTPTGPTTTTAASNSVSIAGIAFTPQSLTVTAGTTVTWTNNDSVTHTVTSTTSVFDSGNLAAGASFSFTFAAAGTFAYKCTIHPSMTGSVTVQ